MRNFKRFISLALVCMLCISLCACGISRDEAVGTWSGTYVYNGSTFAVAFVLESNGDYAKATYKDGEFRSAESGTWEIKSGKVYLHKDGNTGTSTIYKYQGKALVNNDHKFYKG